MNVAVYLRLSKADYEHTEESNSISNQRRMIESYLSEIFSKETYHITEYVDDGFSGTNENRPAYERLIRDVKAMRIQCIVVKDFSRFSRDYLTMGNYLEHIFPFLKVRFIAINDGYDSISHDDGTTTMDIQFKTLLYDYYSKEHSEKVKQAVRKLQHEGKILFEAPFGYTKDPKDKYRIVVDEIGGPIIREVFSLYLKGYSQSEIAKLFNEKGYVTGQERKKQLKGQTLDPQKKIIWTTAHVSRILHNQSYVGDYCYQKFVSLNVREKKKKPKKEWCIIENHHEALVEREKFEQIQKMLKERVAVTKNKKYDNAKPESFLHYLVTCKECGHKMKYSAEQRYGKGAFNRRFRCCNCNLLGNSNTIKAEMLEKSVLERLKEKGWLTNFQTKEKMKEKEKETQERNIQKYENEIKELYESYCMGELTKELFTYKKEIIYDKIEKEKAEIESLEREKHRPVLNMNQDIMEEQIKAVIETVLLDKEGNVEIIFKKIS